MSPPWFVPGPACPCGRFRAPRLQAPCHRQRRMPLPSGSRTRKP
ncbi:hypothetical protein A3768_4124 (plasmid) [Ralstonia solanacearum]|nr:hypothetical protein F504_3668 [Ralstonia pseudosolanacearum FQY_4]ANH34949.1 hypothetical protein A3768_4124 [Ralstonia solanacearum]